MIKIIDWASLDVLSRGTTESIDVCITDCPYKIIAWWVRIVDEWDECSWVLAKRDYSKTDPKWCLNRWRKVISDWTNCSNKWLKKDWDVPNAVKDWKMFKHNEVTFKDWLPDLYRVMKQWTHTYIMINGRNLSELQNEAEICANTEEEKEKLRNWKRCKKKWFIYQNLLIWDKWNVTPNKYYMQWAEFILMLRKWPARNIHDMWSSNIIRIPNIIWKKKHPTEKPVELYEYLLINSLNWKFNKETWEVENVWDTLALDPFAWCWPIITAWKNLNCNVVAIEIDKEYIKLCNERNS